MDSTDISLRDGRSAHLRPTGVADVAELLQGFERMSSHARYMRLMHVVREPNLQRVRAVIDSFPEAGIGLVATVPAADGIDIVGSAFAIFAADRPTCEFAITVDTGFAGTGLATALMTALIAAVRARGMRELEGFVLSENQPMLRLARRLGFSTRYDPDDATVRICRLAL
jgi:acetyltransferase